MAQSMKIHLPMPTIIRGPNGRMQLIWNPAVYPRFNRQYERAQKWLDTEVLKDTTPFVPMQTGKLYQSGIAGSTPGSGIVQWVSPYARYLYYGKLMIDPATGSAWARPNTTKVLTNKDLVFSQAVHPQAQAFWFEASKALNKKKWMKGAKKIAGGGNG